MPARGSGERGGLTTHNTPTSPQSTSIEQSGDGSDSDYSEATSTSPSDSVYLESIPSIEEPFHPSLLLNQHLLDAAPEVEVALTHDDDWCALAQLDEEIDVMGILSSNMVIVDGGAYYGEGLYSRSPGDPNAHIPSLPYSSHSSASLLPDTRGRVGGSGRAAQSSGHLPPGDETATSPVQPGVSPLRPRSSSEWDIVTSASPRGASFNLGSSPSPSDAASSSPIPPRTQFPTQRTYLQNRHSDTIAPSPVSSPANLENRKVLHRATAMLSKEMQRASTWSWNANDQEVEEVELRLRPLLRLERVWGKSVAAANNSSNLRISNQNALLTSGGEERERKVFSEALRDGYVLCQLLNKLRSDSAVKADPREDGLVRTSNITKFLAACSSFGFVSEDLFQRDDLLEASNESLARVAHTIIVLFDFISLQAPDSSRILLDQGNTSKLGIKPPWPMKMTRPPTGSPFRFRARRPMPENHPGSRPSSPFISNSSPRQPVTQEIMPAISDTSFRDSISISDRKSIASSSVTDSTTYSSLLDRTGRPLNWTSRDNRTDGTVYTVSTDATSEYTSGSRVDETPPAPSFAEKFGPGLQHQSEKPSGACIRCKTLKIKCEFRTDSDPCRRCLNGSHDCIVPGSKKRRTPPKREHLLNEIREQAEQINLLVSELEKTQLRSTALAYSHPAYHPVAPDYSPTRSLFPQTSNISEGESVDRQRAVEDWLSKAKESLAQFGDLIGKQQLDERESEVLEDWGDADGAGNDDVDLFRMRPLTDTPSVHPPDGDNILSSPNDILTLGIVAWTQAERLFAVFFNHMNASCWLLDPVLYTAQKTYWCSPFLFTVVCAVASRFGREQPGLYTQLMHHALREAGNALTTGRKSIEMCAAYILLALYPAPSQRWDENRTSLYLGVAIRIATDINLQVPSNPKPTNDTHSRELLSRTRIWLNCFNLDRSIGSLHGKLPTIPNTDYIACHSEDWWRSSPYNLKEFDIHLCAYNNGLRVMSGFIQQVYSNPDHPKGVNKELDLERIATEVDDKLRNLDDGWFQRIEASQVSDDPQTAFRTSLLSLAYSYARLSALSHGFQQTFGEYSTDGNPFLGRCLRAASDVVESYTTKVAIPAHYTYILHGPEAQSTFVTFASAFLIKLLQPKFNPYLTREERVKIKNLVMTAIERLRKPEINIDERSASKLYARLLDGLLRTPLAQVESTGPSLVGMKAINAPPDFSPQPNVNMGSPSAQLGGINYYGNSADNEHLTSATSSSHSSDARRASYDLGAPDMQINPGQVSGSEGQGSKDNTFMPQRDLFDKTPFMFENEMILQSMQLQSTSDASVWQDISTLPGFAWMFNLTGNPNQNPEFDEGMSFQQQPDA